MPVAVELFFDRESERKILELWEIIAQHGLCDKLFGTQSRPHISLAVYNDLPDVNALMQDIIQFARSMQTFSLGLEHVGYFLTQSSAVFLSPGYDAGLLSLHTEYHRAFSKYSAYESAYYLPGRWVPHCALAVDIQKQDVAAVIHAIQDRASPLSATVVKIGLIEFRPVRMLLSIPICTTKENG